MTGLSKFTNLIALKAAYGEQDGFVGIAVDEYIKELEEHMHQWFISDVWEHDYRCDADIQAAIDEILKFLKGEG